ncbi:MAG: DUF1214 domain-containing protein, partial [Deltaproteobacteria bacterium]|nr:DUF1214 domain-containing protein [Deltaproteobacteria bacterium]
MRDGYAEIKQGSLTLGREVNGWRVGAPFGNRAFFHGDWLLRAAAALAGIYGNDMAEAFYPFALTDSKGIELDASKFRYTVTFPKDQYPPVKAFWSVTMYDKKTQLLVDNPINRYLINSPMLPELKKNFDGSLTLYIQKDSPGSWGGLKAEAFPELWETCDAATEAYVYAFPMIAAYKAMYQYN